jgi:hypothetical protein
MNASVAEPAANVRNVNNALAQLKRELIGLGGNRPLEPRALEVEFFPMEEVLHEKVKIH